MRICLATVEVLFEHVLALSPIMALQLRPSREISQLVHFCRESAREMNLKIEKDLLKLAAKEDKRLTSELSTTDCMVLRGMTNTGNQDMHWCLCDSCKLQRLNHWYNTIVDECMYVENCCELELRRRERNGDL